MKNMGQKFDELNTELTDQTTEFVVEMRKKFTVPQVRHHWQPGRIDVDFLCSCSATEVIA